ncbi:MAG: hypothetical protein ABSG42_05725 [Nitrospirota bacterium]
MHCPHLVKDIVYTCNCEDSPVVIECARLRGYCKRGHYIKCPRFASRKKGNMAYAYRLLA